MHGSIWSWRCDPQAQRSYDSKCEPACIAGPLGRSVKYFMYIFVRLLTRYEYRVAENMTMETTWQKQATFDFYWKAKHQADATVRTLYSNTSNSSSCCAASALFASVLSVALLFLCLYHHRNVYRGRSCPTPTSFRQPFLIRHTTVRNTRPFYAAFSPPPHARGFWTLSVIYFMRYPIMISIYTWVIPGLAIWRLRCPLLPSVVFGHW